MKFLQRLFGKMPQQELDAREARRLLNEDIERMTVHPTIKQISAAKELIKLSPENYLHGYWSNSTGDLQYICFQKAMRPSRSVSGDLGKGGNL